MSVESLKASRGKAVVIFTEFTRLYKQNRTALYCFFEGEDSKYYGSRIKNIIRPEKYFYLICNGKEGVLGIYIMLLRRKYYVNVRAAYFVDKDFDVSIKQTSFTGIYETPCYSIENFYTSVECFSDILRNEFHLNELDENFDRCISLYKKRQEDFHNAVELLNAWIACHRKRSSDLNFGGINVLKYVDIYLDKIMVKYTIDDLYNDFQNLPVIPQQELDIKIAELQSNTRQKSFRGKFEIQFLFCFIQKLMDKANTGTYPYFTKEVKVKQFVSKSMIISDLSSYADTPACLYSYLESFTY